MAVRHGKGRSCQGSQTRRPVGARDQLCHRQHYARGRCHKIAKNQIAEIGVLGEQNTIKLTGEGQDGRIERISRDPIGDERARCQSKKRMRRVFAIDAHIDQQVLYAATMLS